MTSKGTDPVAALDEWYRAEREAGRLLDMKFFPGSDREPSLSEAAQIILDVVTGKVELVDISDEDL